MTATATHTQQAESVAPWWYRPLIGWRVVTLVAVALATLGAIVGRGIVFSGPIRWAFVVGLLLATWGTVVALRGTLAQRHSGRLYGFQIDFLFAVIAGFIGFNRMDMFNGLDAVGEAFNGSAAWALIIVLGWLVSGYSDNETIKAAARWTMIAGGAVLLLTMGLLPGIVEFVSRAVQGNVIVFLIVAAVAAYSAVTLWSRTAEAFFGSDQNQVEVMDGLFFVAPNALGFLTFFAGPLVVSLFISFTEWDGLTDAKFVGLQNYIDLLSDDLFVTSLRNILFFGVIAIPAAVLPGLFLAALLNSKLPGMKAFRAVYFLPSIAGVVGVSLIWKQLFNSTVGFINYMILRSTDFINAVIGTDFVAAQPQWISDSNIAMFAVIILFAWQQIGFNTVLFLAGMQGIDGGLYEAADIDGANWWTRFRSITIPLLKPTTVFVVATTTILALQMFNEPFILQSPSTPAGPGNSTLTPVVYLYQNAFQQFEIGYASAVAWALFILIFGVTLLYFRGQKDEGVLSA